VFSRDDLFAQMARLQGEVYRAVANRRTLRFEVGGRAYFAKIHQGAGWAEIFKNLLTLRRAVTGARNEFIACRRLEQCGVPAPTVAAFGERGRNPARRFSFIVCDALEGRESLEDLTHPWLETAPSLLEKRRMVLAVAATARAMHDAGVIHRDFYICHLLARRLPDATMDLAVIDLHRAQVHDQIPRRWLLRDLAALLFSVLDLPLTRRDWLRFVRAYRGRGLREVLRDEGEFWQAVYQRAERLYRKGRRKGLVHDRFQPQGSR
jgi:heptose I phosphotransferase